MATNVKARAFVFLFIVTSFCTNNIILRGIIKLTNKLHIRYVIIAIGSFGFSTDLRESIGCLL